MNDSKKVRTFSVSISESFPAPPRLAYVQPYPPPEVNRSVVSDTDTVYKL